MLPEERVCIFNRCNLFGGYLFGLLLSVSRWFYIRFSFVFLVVYVCDLCLGDDKVSLYNSVRISKYGVSKGS